jgi:pilus assembly protein TadC
MTNLNKFNKESFGKMIIPEKIFRFKFKEELENIIEKLYFDNLNYLIISNIFFLSLILSLIGYFFVYDYIYILFNDYFYNSIWKSFIIFVSWFILNIFVYYFLLFFYYFKNDAKFKRDEEEIEKDLPEFIDNLVSNIKGGISLEKSLLKSVRPEQKALLKEVTLINQKILMGQDVYQALKEFRLRFESQVINRTFFLIEEGIKGGGNIAAPLERISENLKRIYNLDEEIKGSAGGFSMVIRAITIVVAPLLFALALTLLTFIGNLFQLILKSGSQVLPVAAIPEEFSTYLVIFSYSMIVLITFFSSLITSELKGEKIHESIKYVPIYLILSVIIFNILSKILLGFFGNIL